MLFRHHHRPSRMMIQELTQLLVVTAYHRAFPGTLLATLQSSLMEVPDRPFACVQ